MTAEELGVVLADDATGALECASILAGLRYAVTVSIGVPESLRTWEGVLVVDLESRILSGGEARLRLGACLEGLRAHGVRRFYLKTDSTLRGHIGGSLIELLDRSPGGAVVYVPAYPKLRRTVRGGRLFVDGVPLEQTAFAADVRHPVRSSSLLSLFTGEELQRVALVSTAAQLATGGRKILVCDGETEEDLSQIAEVLRESGEGFVAAGPSGFVSYWAGLGRLARRVEEMPRKLRRWLVVCGSLHPQSRAQLALASALGVPTLQSDSCEVISPELAASELAHRVVEEAVKKMTSMNAAKIGIKERGLLKEGYWADIALFDPKTVADRATYEQPHQYPVGIPYVIVNGEVVLDGDKQSGKLPGQVLRGPGYRRASIN